MLGLEFLRSTLLQSVLKAPCVKFVRNGSGVKPCTQRGKPCKGKNRGVKQRDGDEVRRGAVLVKQYRLRYLPGLNVGFTGDRTLVALTEGTVLMTREKVRPNLDHMWMKNMVEEHGESIYRHYFHVIPKPPGRKFKLVDLV